MFQNDTLVLPEITNVSISTDVRTRKSRLDLLNKYVNTNRSTGLFDEFAR